MSERIKIKSKLKNYEVIFADDLWFELKKDQGGNHFYVIDDKIADLYEDKIKKTIVSDRIVIVKANEFNKTLPFCKKLIEKLILMGIRKNNCLVAIGGGIIQDITSFAASIIFRGIEWKYYPTTLLAQADSCIGSKTSINLGKYKNILGNFYPPSKVVVGATFLNTLKTEEIKSGIGEMLHYYLITGGALAEKVKEEYICLINDRSRLKTFVIKSLDIKKQVIERDEYDKGERNLFNYGHTFGHALESVSGYKVNHGQAVTVGMDIANYVSLKLGYLNSSKYGYMNKILLANMPEYDLRKIKMADYIKALSRDKKNIDQNLGCILTKGPGAMFKTQIPISQRFKRILGDYFK